MTRPNIVCVSIDSIRADYCSLFDNAEFDTTPFLRHLRDESTVFSEAISPSIWTLPVHTSIFTGLYPPEHGVLTGEETLGEHPTFAKILSQHGYSTEAFHKMGWLDTGDVLRGFNVSDKIDNEENYNQSIKQRVINMLGNDSSVRKAVEIGYEAQQIFKQWKIPTITTGQRVTKGEELINDFASSMEDVDEPFCKFIHISDAHWRYKPPHPYHSCFSEKNVLSLIYNYVWWQRRIYGSRENRLKTISGEIRPPSDEVENIKSLYRGCIRHCDALMENLVDVLKSFDFWDNTVLIIFSDHGDCFGEDGVFGHHFSLHSCLTKVPLIIYDPTGHVDSGIVSSPVSLIDIYPTILNLAGAPVPETNAVDIADNSRDRAFTFYDITNHDLYTDSSEYGVKKEELPSGKQAAVWKSGGRKGVVHLTEEDNFQSTENIDLLPELQAEINNLQTVVTSEGKISQAAAERLRDIGYFS